MKIGIFALFCAALFLATQRAVNTPLAYFAFFPLGSLMIFYFYVLRDWIFFSLSFALLAVSYFLSGQSFPLLETSTLMGITGACFIFLVSYRRIGERLIQEENERAKMSQQELEELKHKYASRLESLHHLEKQVASLINLFEIARDFNECLNLKETVHILYKKVLPELPFEQAEVILLTPGKKPAAISKLYAITRFGIEEKDSVAASDVEHCWIEKALQQNGFVLQDDVWIFPLTLEGKFDALFVIRGAAREDLAKFEVLASQLALQVRKVRLYEMVRELSIIDGLTGVFVRRHFLERFEEEIKRALKQNFPLSVLMLDIDHFKRYNDEFGHLVGDATLREVSQVIRAGVRNVDIVARYGGEEFVVVIPETREEGAVEVAERIRSTVARRAFRVYDEETRVTLSIGICAFPQDLSPAGEGKYDPAFLFELLQRADRALYQAKEEGRNRVVVYRSSEK